MTDNTAKQIHELVATRIREIDKQINELSKQKLRYERMLNLTESNDTAPRYSKRTGWKVGAQRDVLRVLKEMPGIHFTVQEIAAELDEPNRERVANAANTLARAGQIRRDKTPGTSGYRYVFALDTAVDVS